MICHKILKAELLRPSKLRLRLETKHSQHVGKDRSFFSRQELNMKRNRLDASGSFHQQNAAVVESSFLVSFEIAKKKKPHTIGEELILPCACRALQFLACTLQLHSCVRLSLNINNHEV